MLLHFFLWSPHYFGVSSPRPPHLFQEQGIRILVSTPVTTAIVHFLVHHGILYITQKATKPQTPPSSPYLFSHLPSVIKRKPGLRDYDCRPTARWQVQVQQSCHHVPLPVGYERQNPSIWCINWEATTKHPINLLQKCFWCHSGTVQPVY